MTLLYIYLIGFVVAAIWCYRAKMGPFLGTIATVFWFVSVVFAIVAIRQRGK